MANAAPDVCGLLSLPVEMNMNVFSFALLNSGKDVLNLAMSCKAMYNILMNNQPSILLAFLSQMDPRELAIATAHYHATIAPWRCPEDLDMPVPQDQTDYLHKITDFCEQYLSKQGTELRIPFHRFTFPMVAHIQDIHLIIRRIAATLAPLVMDDRERWPIPAPSSAEMAKISKALYLIDLVRLLFSKSPVTLVQHMDSDISRRDHAFTKFWSCFAPWESYQVELMTGVIINYAIKRLEYGERFGLSRRRDRIRFVLWKGMKGLDPLIHYGPSEDGKRLRRLIREDPRFKAIRRMPAQCPAYWFDGPGIHDVSIDPKVIERYDSDIDGASVRVWLCNCCLGLPINGKAPFGNPLAWEIEPQNSYMFFDMDHLFETCKGRLPSLVDLLKLTEQKIFIMRPFWEWE
ncbi:hypothetical protein F5B21DRAFT_318170 [Xylaria acuta]|nr:hypothetical protein F5B21DRAFT_318170 [Xylaria acuta]